MIQRLLAFVKIYLLAVALSMVQKPLFMLFYAALYAGHLPAGWAEAWFKDFPHDLAIGGFLSLLPGLLLALSALRRGTWLAWTMHVWLGLVSLLFGFGFILGLWLYDLTDLQPDMLTLLSLTDEALAKASSGVAVLGILMVLVCAALAYALFYGLVLRGMWRFTPPRRPWTAFAVMLLLALAAFAPWVWNGQGLHLLQQWDAALLLAINGWHSPQADAFMYAYSGKLVWVPMYASLVYLLFRNLHWRTALFCLIGVALAITFADQVGASLIRPWVERPRPSNPASPVADMVHLVNGYRGGRYGFPSCHAANTFGLAFYLMFVVRQRGLTCFLMGWALLTCYSRAYLGVHYPGDLLTGAALGLVGAAIAYGLFRWASRYKRPRHFRHLWVPMAVGGLTIAGMLAYALW